MLPPIFLAEKLREALRNAVDQQAEAPPLVPSHVPFQPPQAPAAEETVAPPQELRPAMPRTPIPGAPGFFLPGKLTEDQVAEKISRIREQAKKWMAKEAEKAGIPYELVEKATQGTSKLNLVAEPRGLETATPDERAAALAEFRRRVAEEPSGSAYIAELWRRNPELAAAVGKAVVDQELAGRLMEAAALSAQDGDVKAAIVAKMFADSLASGRPADQAFGGAEISGDRAKQVNVELPVPSPKELVSSGLELTKHYDQVARAYLEAAMRGDNQSAMAMLLQDAMAKKGGISVQPGAQADDVRRAALAAAAYYRGLADRARLGVRFVLLGSLGGRSEIMAKGLELMTEAGLSQLPDTESGEGVATPDSVSREIDALVRELRAKRAAASAAR